MNSSTLASITPSTFLQERSCLLPIMRDSANAGLCKGCSALTPTTDIGNLHADSHPEGRKGETL